MNSRFQIEKLLALEADSFNTKNVDLFLDIVHPDMVWAWPPDVSSHDPLDWIMPMGRYHRGRWGSYLNKFFQKYTVVHNVRTIKKIQLTKEEDGAVAIVDVDTLWETSDGVELHWLGRACKLYTYVDPKWMMISQTGLLRYK